MTKAMQLFPAHEKITGSANTLFCPEQKPRVGMMPWPRGIARKRTVIIPFAAVPCCNNEY